jgi:hypothetical protein
VALSKSMLKRFNDCLDMMSRRMDGMEAEQKARHDDEDFEHDITNPLEAPSNAPFSDSPPEKIHGEGESKEDDFWNKPEKPPIPIMRL